MLHIALKPTEKAETFIAMIWSAKKFQTNKVNWIIVGPKNFSTQGPKNFSWG